MSSFSEIPPRTLKNARQQSAEDATTCFRRRTLSNRRCLWPRRYVLALFLFILLLIQASRNFNAALTLTLLIHPEEFTEVENFSMRNWTMAELEYLTTFMDVSDIFASIIGALLVFAFSSYKFLLVSVTVSSILHILTPAALNQHSNIFFVIVMIGQGIVSVPTYTAVLSMWKEWAPPDERTRLLTFSFCAVVLEAVAAVYFFHLYQYFSATVNYYAGIAGIIWALFWYNISSDTPQNDPLISEREFLYLESNIPSNVQEKIKLRDVPWKSIVKSPQILILCLVFFKMSCWVETIEMVGIFFIYQLDENDNPFQFHLSFVATTFVVLVTSSLVMDFLLKKYRNYTLNIRKYFLCGGFLLQFVLLLGTFSSSEYANVIFIILAYSVFAISVPGILRYPLDLSPRYVSIIAGIGFAFYSLGKMCLYYILEMVFHWQGLDAIGRLFLFDGLLSLIIAIIFGIWGDVEEQRWSLILSSNQRGSDYKCYPQPDDEDISLVSENM